MTWSLALDIGIDIASWLLLLAGSFFYLVGAVGVFRMPDVYTRMHAASVTETLGSGLIIGGLMLQAGWTLITLKLFIIGALFFMTGPVVTHALAQAALHMAVWPKLKDEGDIAKVVPVAIDTKEADKDKGRES